MAAFAIIDNGGKQYKVSVGSVIELEKLDTPEGETVTFPLVVLTSDGEKATVGTPFIEGASVSGTVLENGRADKVVVIHKQSKKRMLKKRGHRQPFTKVEITSI